MTSEKISRRDVLAGIAAMPIVGAIACSAPSPGAPPSPGAGGRAGEPVAARAAGTVPAIFVAHGAPTLALDRDKGGDFAAWAAAMARARTLLVVSAHWEANAPALGTVERRPLMYDFGGFPPEMYRIQYPAPGAPDVAARVRAILAPRYGQVASAPDRAWDHGVWVPLVHMYPHADVPVLQLALPRVGPEELVALGRALAPLRDEGVMIVGSGNLTHNLRRIDWDPAAPVPGWASDFDAWCAEVLGRGDLDGLIEYRARAPALAMAHPTHEHFTPLLVVAGAGADGARGGRATFPVLGFEHGSISRRSVQIA